MPRDLLIITHQMEPGGIVLPHRWVTLAAGGEVQQADDPSQPLIGCSDDVGGFKGRVDVWRQGQALIQAGGMFEAGAALTSDASGRAVAAGAGDQIGGYADEGARPDDIVNVFLARGRVASPDEDQALRDTVESAVQLASVRTSDRDLVLASDGGEAKSVSLPGISVRDADALIGPAWGIDEIQISGPGVTVSRLISRAVVEVAASVAPDGGLNAAAVDARIRALVSRFALLASHTLIPMYALPPVNALSTATFTVAAGAGPLAGTVGAADLGLYWNLGGQDFRVRTFVQSERSHAIEIHVTNGSHRSYYAGHSIVVADGPRLLIEDADEVHALAGDITSYVFHRTAEDLLVGVRYTVVLMAPIELDNFLPIRTDGDNLVLGRIQGKPAWVPPAAAGAESITLEMLAAAVAARLVPTGGDAGQYLGRAGAGMAWSRPPRWAPGEHQQEVFNAFDGAGWGDEGNDAAADAWVSQTAYISDPTTLILSATQFVARGANPAGTLMSDRYVIIRVPQAADFSAGGDRYRLAVGNHTETPADWASVHLSSTWTALADASETYDYYYVQAPTIPGDENWWVQQFDRFRLDPDRVENVPADWAERSNRTIQIPTELLPRTPHVQGIHDGPGIGLTSTDTDRAVQAAFTAFDPPFVVRAATRGECDIEARLTIATRSDDDLGFGSDAADTWRITDIVFASTLAALAEYAVGTTSTWLEVGNGVDLYRGADKLGKISLYLGRNAQDQIGYFLRDSGGGNAGLNYSVSLHLGMLFSPTDAG